MHVQDRQYNPWILGIYSILKLFTITIHFTLTFGFTLAAVAELFPAIAWYSALWWCCKCFRRGVVLYWLGRVPRETRILHSLHRASEESCGETVKCCQNGLAFDMLMNGESCTCRDFLGKWNDHPLDRRVYIPPVPGNAASINVSGFFGCFWNFSVTVIVYQIYLY